MLENDPYERLIASLAPDGIRCRFQEAHQLTVSRQIGPIWPNRGNSFWVTHATGSWHLFTWSPVGYRVPDSIDIVELCRTCMEYGPEAMHVVPEQIVEAFRLERLSVDEEGRVFQAMGLRE